MEEKWVEKDVERGWWDFRWGIGLVWILWKVAEPPLSGSWVLPVAGSRDSDDVSADDGSAEHLLPSREHCL